jgi:hypothetical protein
MMPDYPRPTSAVYVSLLAQPATRYVPDCWVASNGEANGSLRYDHDRLALTIQGRPIALRELAAALLEAVELTERTYPIQAKVEGVAG